MSGYSHLCRDLIAFLVARGYATARSDYLRQLEEMDAELSSITRAVPVLQPKSVRALFTPASLFLYKKHPKPKTNQPKKQLSFSDVLTNSIISIYLVWEPVVVNLWGLVK